MDTIGCVREYTYARSSTEAGDSPLRPSLSRDEAAGENRKPNGDRSKEGGDSQSLPLSVTMDWFQNVALLKDSMSMVLVGALWGCTNPLLRKGSVEATPDSEKKSRTDSFLIGSLRTFLNIKIWLPYVLNQSGSIVFYILLAKSDLSLAVPICNALALLFSFVTSLLLGEPMQKPFRSVMGATLVVVGATICVSTQNDE